MKKAVSFILSLVFVISSVTESAAALSEDDFLYAVSSFSSAIERIFCREKEWKSDKSISEISRLLNKYDSDRCYSETARDDENAKTKTESPYLTRRIVIRTADGKIPGETYGAVDCALGEDGYCVLQYKDEKSTKNAAELFNADRKIEYAVCDGVVSASALKYREGASLMQTDRYISSLDKAAKSREMTVAVIDTGADISHPFLKNRLVSGYNVYSDSADVTDKNSHGTHVAGIIADNTPDNVKIMPVKVLDKDGNGTDVSVAAGIEYAIKRKVNVINMSLGGECIDDNCPIALAVRKAIKSGITVVVAAGNDAADTDEFCPARIKECITVASCKADCSMSSFSNYGSAVDVTAPGDEIYSSVPNGKYERMSGTSMASPAAAAACALILAKEPLLKPSQVESKLKACCADCLIKGNDVHSGAGIINFGILLGDSKKATKIEFGTDEKEMIYFSKASASRTQAYTSGEKTNEILIDRSFTVTSSNSSVATYDGFYIFPKSQGTAVITAKLPTGASTKITVKITKREVWIDYAASKYAGGKGTKESPYIIKTAEQLAKFAKDYRSGKKVSNKCYKLANDIDLKGKYWITATRVHRKSIHIITDNESFFGGVFDGNNHKIKNMTVFDEPLNSAWNEENPINAQWYDMNTGFMGVIFGGTVKNLGIENAYCAAPDAALLAREVMQGSRISNCYTTGFSGGSGFVDSIENYDIVIKNCFSSATVAGSGIAKVIYSSMDKRGGVKLSNVFFCGEMTGRTGSSENAGFAERITGCKKYEYTTLYNCFSAVKSPTNYGFAYHQEYSKIYKCYYLSGNASGIGENVSTKNIDLAKRDMKFFKTKSSYTNSKLWNTSYKWDFDKVWAIDSKVNNGFPYLKKMKPSKTAVTATDTWLDLASDSFAGGKGTKSSPYLISTPGELARLSKLYRFGGGENLFFKLTSDIDLGAHKWYPIGGGKTITKDTDKYYPRECGREYFSGNIDGNGKTIFNLSIEAKGSYIGFICAYDSGTIKNLNFKNVNVTGTRKVGAVCGCLRKYATVYNSSVSGKVKAKENDCGGIAGEIQGTASLIGCKSSAQITAKLYAGGLVAHNSGTVESCSYTPKSGAITSSLDGYAVGYNFGYVSNCYSIGYPLTASGTITASYYVSPEENAVYKESTVENVIAYVSDTQLKNKSTYSSFDFENVWEISKNKNGGYPILRKAKLPVKEALPKEKWSSCAAKSFAAGDGTKKNPYLIADAKQLAFLNNSLKKNDKKYTGKYYRLIKNIDLDGKLWGFGNTSGTYDIVKFYFDGNNKTISNLTAPEGGGLFNFLLSKGYVKNLKVKNVKGKAAFGIVAHNNGVISDSSVTGELYESGYTNGENDISTSVGGICLNNTGTVQRCSVNAKLTGWENVGGIAGYNTGKIKDCWTKGTYLSAGAEYISGKNTSGKIINCYSVAKLPDALESLKKSPYTVAKTADLQKLKKKDTFKGFDFEKVWAISSSKNGGYPYLISKPSRKITYILNGGRMPKYSEYSYIPGFERELRSPSQNGKVFDGWYSDKKCKKRVLTVGETDKGDITLYAKWKDAYTVKFYANGGKGTMSSQKVPVSQKVNLNANTFKRKGYVFIGWAKEKDGKVIYKNKAEIRKLAKKGETVRLYAIWKKK